MNESILNASDQYTPIEKRSAQPAQRYFYQDTFIIDLETVSSIEYTKTGVYITQTGLDRRIQTDLDWFEFKNLLKAFKTYKGIEGD